MTDRILQTLSIASKAGMISSGESAVLSDIRSFKSYLVLIAGDASDGTRKKLTDKCIFYEVPYYTYGTKESMAHAIGKDMRSFVSVNDSNFAEKIISRLEGSDRNGE